MMTSCELALSALDEALVLEDVAAAAVDHAEGCVVCGPVYREHQELALVMARARRAHEAHADLPPSSWVAIREGVDRAVGTRSGPSWRWLALAAAGAVAAVALWAAGVLPGGQDAPGIAASHGLALAPVASGVGTPGPSEVPPVVAAEPVPGELLTAGGQARSIKAFGRHDVRLAAGAKVRVRRWSPAQIVLELEAGAVTCDVNRAADEERFVVRADDVTVTVRGTVFTVLRRGDGATDISVERGQVAVEVAEEEAQYVAAGERLTVGLGELGADDGGSDVPELTSARQRRSPRRQPKVVAIDVPDGAAPMPRDAAVLADAFKAIEAAASAGACDRVARALAAVGKRMPREAWPTAALARIEAACPEVSP